MQLRGMCTANERDKMLTDIMGAEWLGNLTSEQVRQQIVLSITHC